MHACTHAYTQDGEHQHDASVTSLSIVESGDVDFELVQDWVHTLLQVRSDEIRYDQIRPDQIR